MDLWLPDVLTGERSIASIQLGLIFLGVGFVPVLRFHTQAQAICFDTGPAHASNFYFFACGLIWLGVALTQGPNMAYIMSRSICQGRCAGRISLGGVALGFVFDMMFAALVIMALLMAVPFAYDALRMS